MSLLPLTLLVVWMVGGCGSTENTETNAKLQEQIWRLAQQLHETKKQVDGLQEANQRSVRSLEELEATVERLTASSTASGTGMAFKGNTGPTGTNSQRVSQFQVPSEVLAAKVMPLSPPASGGSGLQSEDLPSAANEESLATVAAVSCSQVWKQLGQGKSTQAAAQALGVSSAAIQACEQRVGRNSGS